MGFWAPDANAPRDVERLAAYVDQQLGLLSQVLDTFQIVRDSYVPVWTHSDSTNPAIGNGTLKAHAFRWGELAFVQLSLIIGSTTTFEATASPGQWQFSVPWACAGDLGLQVGSARVEDAGTLFHAGTCAIEDGDTFFVVVAENTNSSIRKDQPFTWAVNDELHATIMYPVAP